MNHALLLAAMCAAPLYACAHEGGPGGTSHRSPGQAAQPPCAGDADVPAHAMAALPARASATPAPQLGAVAPAVRLPSQAQTASMRAMAAAAAKEAGKKEGAGRPSPADCEIPERPGTPQGSIRQG